MLRTLWLFYLYNGLDAVFSLQFRLPPLPSLPSSMAGFTLIPPLLLGDFISEREIIQSVDVSQLRGQNKQRGWMGIVI